MQSQKRPMTFHGTIHTVLLVLLLSPTVLSCNQAGKMLDRVREALPFGHATYRSDFYTAVNQEWLDLHKKPPIGFPYWNPFTELRDENDAKMMTLLDDLTAEQLQKGSKEQKLADYYLTAGDMGERDAAAVEPLRTYLDAYANATNLSELVNADVKCLKGCGVANLLAFDVQTNDDGVPILEHVGPHPGEYDVYRGRSGQRAYMGYLTELFRLAGNSPKDAGIKAKKVYAYEKTLSGYTLSAAERSNPVNRIPYPMYLFRTLYSGFDFPAFFGQLGYKPPESIVVYDQRLMEKAAASFTESNRETLALYAQARLLDAFALNLSSDFVRNKDRFFAKLYNYTPMMNRPEWPKRLAVMNTQGILNEYLGEAFCKVYFSPQAKQDIEKMVTRIKAVYKTQIENTDWMDPYTKERALVKLDALSVKVGCPDVWPDSFGQVDIRGKTDGGTYFANLNALLLARNANASAKLGKPLERGIWQVPAYTVNAFNYSGVNEIVFPAGILQEPFYKVEWSEAQNLGAIGTVIAHEISHAFDANGSQYNEKGAIRKWWSKADSERFKDKCARIVAFYDKIPIAPGIKNEGKLTLSENISDILGVQCTLGVLAETPDPDYRTFFISNASIWHQVASWKLQKYLSRNEVHSNAKIRVNRTLSNFQEFQDTFGVMPGDAMYVKPEDRVGIW